MKREREREIGQIGQILPQNMQSIVEGGVSL